MEQPVSEAQWLQADTQAVLQLEGFERERVQFVECSVGRVVVKGQRVARGAWRFALLNGLARLLRLPMLRAAPAPGGKAQQATEVARLKALAAAGVPVPKLWWVASDRFAMGYIAQWSLSHEWHANQSSAQQQLALWQSGARALADVHQKGQALSQAFARNFLWHREQVWFIDFEDDPLSVMGLEDAQARDWLAYLHSSVYILSSNHPELRRQMLLFLKQEKSTGRLLSANFFQKRLQKLVFLRFLPSNRKRYGRDIVAVQALGAFLHDLLATSPSE
jgi:tRNA A-37 threonylcarbamoyl transferase component Bud32